jgi:YegS/Rv2252/BmrU family lipid kinase
MHVIINPASGQGDTILNTINEHFNPAPFAWQVSVTKEEGDATRQAEQAIAEGADAIAVYGGDGTVIEVCNTTRSHEVPIGILPGGTGNALARSLGIPQELQRAAKLLASPGEVEVTHVDAGIVEGKVFAIGLLTGFAAKTIENTSRQSKDSMGMIAYSLSMLREMQNYEAATYLITIDDEETVTIEAAALNVLNVGNVGVAGVSLVPDGGPTDGCLHIIAFESNTLGELASALATAASLDELGISLPRWTATNHIRIETEPAHPWLMDGQIPGTMPLEIDIEPGALPFLVPKGS